MDRALRALRPQKHRRQGFVRPSTPLEDRMQTTTDVPMEDSNNRGPLSNIVTFRDFCGGHVPMPVAAGETRSGPRRSPPSNLIRLHNGTFLDWEELLPLMVTTEAFPDRGARPITAQNEFSNNPKEASVAEILTDIRSHLANFCGPAAPDADEQQSAAQFINNSQGVDPSPPNTPNPQDTIHSRSETDEPGHSHSEPRFIPPSSTHPPSPATSPPTRQTDQEQEPDHNNTDNEPRTDHDARATHSVASSSSLQSSATRHTYATANEQRLLDYEDRIIALEQQLFNLKTANIIKERSLRMKDKRIYTLEIQVQCLKKRVASPTEDANPNKRARFA